MTLKKLVLLLSVEKKSVYKFEPNIGAFTEKKCKSVKSKVMVNKER